MAFGDFTVTRASTKLRIGSNGLYGSVANNVPAFEFNTDGTYRGLLVEPGATNLVIRSQEFNTWSLTRTTVTADATTAPDGTSTADKLLDTVDANTHFIGRAGTVADATVHTLSVFAKKGEYDFMRLEQGNNSHGAYFNLATGAVVGATTYNPTITNVGNGWYRCTVTVTSITTSLTVVIAPSPNGTSINYTGTGTSGIFIWQAQLELGSVATSPIVTTGSTANRVADSVSLASASSLIGQSSGTIYAEFEALDFQASSALRVFQVADGSANRLQIVRGTSTKSFDIQVFANSVNVVSINSGALTLARVVHKIALRYETGNTRACVNTTLSTLNTTAYTFSAPLANVGAGNAFDGSLPFNGYLRSLAIFPTPLADATLQSITTA